jgi:hypothetical protein
MPKVFVVEGATVKCRLVGADVRARCFLDAARGTRLVHDRDSSTLAPDCIERFPDVHVVARSTDVLF